MDIPDINLTNILQYETKYNDLPIENKKFSLQPFNLIGENNKGGILQNYLRSINPTELYHGGTNTFNRFNPNLFGSSNGMYSGYGAYLTDNPMLAKSYGEKVSRFYLPQDYQLSNYDNAFIDNIDYYKNKYPFLAKDTPPRSGWVRELFGKNMADFLDRKGITGTSNKLGFNDASEYVIYDPDKLAPANTLPQRIANRFFNRNAIRYGSQLANRLMLPLAIYDGLSQPVARDEEMLPSPLRLEGGIKYYGE